MILLCIFLALALRNINGYTFTSLVSKSASFGFGFCSRKHDHHYHQHHHHHREGRYARWGGGSMGRRITTSSGRLYVQQKDKKSVLNREIEDEGYYKLEQDQMYERNHKLMETVKDDEDSYSKYSKEELGGNYVAPNGFDIDWELEKARRIIEGPAFAPLRMTLWQPPEIPIEKKSPPGFIDNARIFMNNALQLVGLAESFDGAPLVQGISSYNGTAGAFLSRIIDGNLVALAGGPLFLMLEGYFKKYGPIFKLTFGPKSFMIVSDPVMAKHILKENPLNYDKGILAEILEPVMGKGLIPADHETWKVRRKAIVPGFHKAWLNAMMNLFVRCNDPLIDKLTNAAHSGSTVYMETEFCSVALDIIGKAVFNYEFGSVTTESPVVKAVYSALQESERRSTSFIPYWNLPFAKHYMKQLQDFESNMDLLNKVLNELIEIALKDSTQADIEELENRDYEKMENPSLLRFLVDMRGEESTSRQLRDDLMTMLIAGHETTAAVLTWTLYELHQQPKLLEAVRNEIETVLGEEILTYEIMMNMPLLRNCIAETLRMYPEPPLLIRRALDDDILPQGGAAGQTYIPKGTDIFISTWNIHRDPAIWANPEMYDPYRFERPNSNPDIQGWGGYKPGGGKQAYPNEVHSDFAFLPFGGGSRKCVGDQFAMMESTATLVQVLRRFDFELLSKPEDVGMRTGATIHTENNLPMRITIRKQDCKDVKQE